MEKNSHGVEEAILDAAAQLAAKEEHVNFFFEPNLFAPFVQDGPAQKAVELVKKVIARFEFKGSLRLLNFAFLEPRIFNAYSIRVDLMCSVLDIEGKRGLMPLSNSCAISFDLFNSPLPAEHAVEMLLLCCVKELWEHEFKEGLWLDGKHFDPPHTSQLRK